ncbi:hypothetical protein K1T71_004768 [Dendrolimus kikuchii]|uniref:Uncharacterized protein n=1 Tax=Dendrolimus kikuchii TaxID=765133 RepID=A0ACC1D9D7_9NEOP|nr:hypothetical protein K1T71_004768 [Dendrolimus kikuchii]
MHTTLVISVLLICECLTIRVPIAWDNGVNSEVQNENQKQKDEFSVETFQPKNNARPEIPTEYFEYTAKKPQFAIDIAQQHGVHNPDQHFKAQAVRPHTGKQQPHLGIHHMLDEDKNVFKPYQNYVKSEALGHVTPVSSNYEIFHPYKAEEPALQAIYKDPMLAKIRNDLENSKNRLQNYEKRTAEPNITKDEYLEGEKETDKKLFPQKNLPTQFEIHRPQRRPVYYIAPPRHNHRDQVLNQRFKHPWNQNFVKIRPIHYRPLQNHIHNLRHHHSMKYDDERNEYPQVQVVQDFAEPQEGIDIYEKGKEKYEKLKDNLDESINKVVLENRPKTYKKLEMQSDEPEERNDEEDEFVPVKNYAQVRKTETLKHLPRIAAFADAETYDEIRNAPRLREAVKSTKSQTVYTEEGYEDAAYDHAGEQKHASDHEGHSGHLKEKEISGGKYKIPSVHTSYDDDTGSEYRDQILHGIQWKNNNKDKVEENEAEDYAEVEQEQLIDADIYAGNSDNENISRSKREHHNNTISIDNNNDTIDAIIDTIIKNDTTLDHDVDKRETNFEVPEFDLNSTLLTEEDILRISKLKIEPHSDEGIKEKYPYYFKNLKSISIHSPLRYAENLKLIPKKSKGGTEFYDSRTQFECPEVEDIDPVPEKLKKGENPTESDENEDEEIKSTKGEKNFDTVEAQPRLKGLGDKIDCFKAKYFGENPLDSPFFSEEIIAHPEPVTVPNLPIYNLKETLEQSIGESTNIINGSKRENKDDLFTLLEKLRKSEEKLPLNKTNEELNHSVLDPNITTKNSMPQNYQSNVYIDVLHNIDNYVQKTTEPDKIHNSSIINYKESSKGAENNYKFYDNKDEITMLPSKVRRKRGATFIYEPYKIIRDSQVQDSKKTTTTSNVSPLIKQLQSSRVVDKVSKDKEYDKPVKRYVSTRTYKDIGKNDRPKPNPQKDKELAEPSFIDVNADQRRGEPRYEIRPVNHKHEYTPEENKKTISLEDYKSKTNANMTLENTGKESREERSTQPQIKINSRRRRPTAKPVFDVSQYVPTSSVSENVAASNNVRRYISSTTTPLPKPLKEKLPDELPQEDDSEEDYDEYDDEDDDDTSFTSTTTTTTTTVKPTFRRRSRGTTTTTEEPQKLTTETPKLKLVTRFRDYSPSQSLEMKEVSTEKENLQYRETNPNAEDIEVVAPRYREKKKKTTKSTFVTDTKKYGNGEDDMRKEEIDAMIGVKHDMDDYMPMYEKEVNDKDKSDYSNEEKNESDEDTSDEEEEEIHEMTTPEPTKRTLSRTTDAPTPTAPSHSAKLEIKPIVLKKKIEIHKELPVNKSSPHVTQYKQDIKEVEIVKEIPQRRKSQKDTEALEYYKDDNLPKDVNKLDDVEVFKENLDLINGPRHGGNYRSIEDVSEIPSEPILPKDAVASQSENKKQVEFEDYGPKRMHGGNLKSIGDIQRPRNIGRSAKYTEISDVENKPKAMHGGNLRYDTKPRRGNSRSEKLIEFNDKDADRSEENDDNYKTYGSRTGPMHGGNYKSAKLVAEDDIEVKKSGRDASKKGAVLLNSFAQAIPILTTTPGYILDPSKRMYYYVET